MEVVFINAGNMLILISLIFRLIFELWLLIDVGIVIVLCVFKLPLLEHPSVFGLHSEFGPVICSASLSHMHGILPADDIFELFHLQIHALEDLGFGHQAGEFVDFGQFGFEFLQGLGLLPVFKFQLFVVLGQFRFKIVIVG